MRLFLLRARIKDGMSGIMVYSQPVDVNDDDLDILRRAVRESVKRLRPVWKSVLDRAAKS